LSLGLPETPRPRQTAVDGPDHERDGPSPEKESKSTRQDRRNRQQAQDHVEFTPLDSRSRLPPGLPFKCQTKDIVESCQDLAAIIIPKDPTKTPGVDSIEPKQANDLDGMKWTLLAAHSFLVTTTNN
jgi:hypothetical protein